MLLDEGIIFASDPRTNAGVDTVAKLSNLTVFEQRGDRVIILLSSGNLAGSQAVMICYERDSLEARLRRRFDEDDPYFTAVAMAWAQGTRRVFSQLPQLRW
jgi:predicted proteasome-type protease